MLVFNLIVSSHVTFLKKNKTQKRSVANSTNNTFNNDSNNDEPRVHSGYCLMKINNYFYDLTPLWAADRKSNFKTYSKTGEQINFNICGRNARSVCSNKNSMAISNIRCIEYAGDIDQDRIWTKSKNAANRTVLTLELPHGELCKTNGTTPIFYKTFYELTCDERKYFEIARNQNYFDVSSCVNTIKMNTRFACPSSKFRPWWKQFGIPKQAVGVLLILIGLYFMILGNTLWKFNNFIINFAIQGLIIYSFLNIFFNVNMLICMLLGLTVALAVFYFQKAAAVTLGIVVGYLFGTLSYNIFVKILPINPQTLYWSLIILSILGLGVLGGFIDQYMVILATSLVGGYAFVRGISVFAGNYPDETYVMKLINAGEYSQFGRVYGKYIYLYMFGILFSTGVGFLIQYLIMPAPAPAEENKPEEEKAVSADKKGDNANTNPTSQTENKGENPNQGGVNENNNAGGKNEETEKLKDQQ